MDRQMGDAEKFTDADIHFHELLALSTGNHMLATLIRPTTGSAEVAGFDTGRNAVRAREAIGIVFQELDLFPHLTVAENMALANPAVREGFLVQAGKLRSLCRRGRRRPTIHEFASEELAVSHRIGNYPRHHRAKDVEA